MKHETRYAAMDRIGKKRNDIAYLHAFKHGFDKNYCSSKVKFYTKEEIDEYKVDSILDI
jgi:hypothetical protein